MKILEAKSLADSCILHITGIADRAITTRDNSVTYSGAVPYLLWNENRGPNVVIEITSSSTKNEDVKKKYAIYQNVLKVEEYFLFDPRKEYLKPSMRGYRLVDGAYQPIEPDSEGRLVSEQLHLHLERDGEYLRLWDPVTKTRLLSADEKNAVKDALLEKLQLENDRLRAAQENGHGNGHS